MRIKEFFNKFFSNLTIFKLASFISSMFPLSIYLMLNYFSDSYNILGLKYFTPKLVSVLIFSIELLSIFYLLVFYFHSLKELSKTKSRKVEFLEITQEKTNTSNYLLTNILPIITLDYCKGPVVIFTIILLVSLCFMYIRNNLYYINPIYDIFNIKVYSCNVKYKGGTTEKPIIKKKTVISNVNIYDFRNTYFSIIEDSDVIFVINELKN